MKLLRIITVIVALAAALMLLFSGPGTRLNLWEFGFGFTLMRWAVHGGVAAAILAVVLLLIPAARRGGTAALTAALAQRNSTLKASAESPSIFPSGHKMPL